MEKDKWYRASEIEANRKNAAEKEEINAETYNLPILSIDLGADEEITESIGVDNLVSDFLTDNPELQNKIITEKLDVIAHKSKGKDGKSKWILIIGFGFAAIGLGIAGYKLIHKYKKEIDISVNPQK